jgi:hypothetical protein
VESTPQPPEGKSATRIPEKTYRSSSFSGGNFHYPDSLTLANDGILFRKAHLFGTNEEHVNYKAVASFQIKDGIFFPNSN